MYYKTANGSSDDVQDAIDDDTPDALTPSEIVGAFMAGEGNTFEFFGMEHRNESAMANDFMDLLEVIRHYKYDNDLTWYENHSEKLARINEYLDEALLEYVEIK